MKLGADNVVTTMVVIKGVTEIGTNVPQLRLIPKINQTYILSDSSEIV